MRNDMRRISILVRGPIQHRVRKRQELRDGDLRRGGSSRDCHLIYCVNIYIYIYICYCVVVAGHRAITRHPSKLCYGIGWYGMIYYSAVYYSIWCCIVPYCINVWDLYVQRERERDRYTPGMRCVHDCFAPVSQQHWLASFTTFREMMSNKDAVHDITTVFLNTQETHARASRSAVFAAANVLPFQVLSSQSVHRPPFDIVRYSI